ncbi:uncharacterized protein LOC119745300 isoform X1 [Patiria miniata]|uniref:Uncharacterized protein n=1 Tax=Patiria miniata TaxID=46514 RepID=A0A914BP61_PATMI|nr:uncharacterized protein LOC119745300 isoform X1 [Patiria miniata]
MVEKHADSTDGQTTIPGAVPASSQTPPPNRYNKGIEDYDELLEDEPRYLDEEPDNDEDIEEDGDEEDEEAEGEDGDSGAEDVPEEKVEEKEVKERVQSSTGRKKKKKKKKFIGINLSGCKYDSVKRMSKKFGMKEVTDDEDWTLLWTDCSVSLERVMEMKRFQKVNHFPGMGEICRKDLLGRNLTRMLKLFPKEYAIFPRTWVLPADYGDFQAFCRTKKNKTYITKPESGCQGKGIAITRNPKDIKPGEHMVCQQYLAKPFLIDGFKVDLRVYVVVTSCDPLRVYVYKDGLARFATVKYTEPTNNNLDDVYMHLTNYAINKHSSDFIRDEEKGSKRRLSTLRRWFDENGYDSEAIWEEMYDVIIKTLISAHPILKHNYRSCFSNITNQKGSSCFEVLGFDVMLDKKLKAWILEVNLSPSFHTDHKLDKEVKEGLLFDTMNIINLTPFDRKKCLEEERRRVKDRLMQRGKKEPKKEESLESLATIQDALIKYEDEHLGGFTRIYPKEGSEKYDKYFQHSGSLFQETAASKARGECARQQREELRLKQEKLEMMLKKKPSERRDPEGMRPESPGREKIKRRSRVNIPRVAYGKRLNQSNSQTEVKQDQEFINTKEPADILEEEELERVSSLLQRDNLVRGLGVVEHVYRLLHCTPGTVGVMKNAERQANALVDHSKPSHVCTRRLCTSRVAHQMNAFLHLETPPALRSQATNPKHLPTLPNAESRKLGRPSAQWSEVYTYSINLDSNEAQINDVFVKDPSAIAAQASRSQNNSAGSSQIVVQDSPGNRARSKYKVICWPAGCQEPLTVHSIGRSRRFLHVRQNKKTREIVAHPPQGLMPRPPSGSQVFLERTEEEVVGSRLKKQDSVETLQSISEHELQDLSGKSSRLTFSDHMAITMPPDVNALRPNNLPYAVHNPPSSYTHQISVPSSTAMRIQPHPPGHVTSGQWQSMLAKNSRGQPTHNPHQPSAYAVAQNPNPTTLQQRHRFVPRKGYPTGREARLANTVVPEVEWKHLAHLLDPETRGAPAGGSRLITQGQNDWRCVDCVSGGVSHQHHSQDRRILSANTHQRRDYSTNPTKRIGAVNSTTNLTTVTMCATPPNIYIGGASSNHNFPNLIRVTQSPTSGGPATLNLSVVSGPAPVLHRPEVGSAGSKHSVGRVERLGSANVNDGYLRSTKSQRLRGTSNTLRLKQLEMRENHAVVLS